MVWSSFLYRGFLFGPLALARHDCQPVGRVVSHGELWAVEVQKSLKPYDCCISGLANTDIEAESNFYTQISQEVKVGEEITIRWGAVHCPCLCCSGLHGHNPCLMCDPALANTGYCCKYLLHRLVIGIWLHQYLIQVTKVQCRQNPDYAIGDVELINISTFGNGYIMQRPQCGGSARGRRVLVYNHQHHQ